MARCLELALVCAARLTCTQVNMGEALEYWTDGRLKACFHRVRASCINVQSIGCSHSISSLEQA